MLSIRTFSRSAPRALNRIARTQSVARPAFYKSAIAAAARPATFSTTVRRWAPENDAELSSKLGSELQIEEDMKASEQEPSSVKDFLANTPFELEDVAGNEVVKLTRKYNDEKITVSFSIADITNYDPFSEDPALEDEDAFEDDLPKGRNAEQDQALEEEDPEDDLEPASPVTLSIVIEKPGKSSGALTVDATAQSGNIVVDNIFYFDDVAVAKADSPSSAHKRADTYPGPPFGTLDDDLQVLMERYLEDRGISQALAVFVPDYVDVKEQKEYVRWLDNVKNFVDA